jgi:hypothetical protein
MNIHAEKSKENTTSPSQIVQQKATNNTAFQFEDNRPQTVIQKKINEGFSARETKPIQKKESYSIKSNNTIQLVKYVRKKNGQIKQVPDGYNKPKKEKWAEAPAAAAAAPLAAAAPAAVAPVAPDHRAVFLATPAGNLRISGGQRSTLAGTRWFKVLYGDPDYSLHIHVRANGGINHADDKIKNRSGSSEIYVDLTPAFNQRVRALNPFRR